MRVRPFWVAASACLLAAGCGRRADRPEPKAAPEPAMSPAGSGPSNAVAGTDGSSPAGGVPPGYVGRTDDSTKSITGVSYTTVGNGMWEVESGTHDQNLSHIMYSPRDSARGEYTVRTEIDQISGPMHPEAAGVFIGGQDLAGPDQRYAYFLVRGDGQYSIKLRQGPKASILVPFTASPNVPAANAAGRVNYPLKIVVAKDSVSLLVNEQRVAAIARAAIPTDGITGIRVNHGLHLMVKPLVIAQ